MGTKVVYVWQLKDRIGGYTKVAHSCGILFAEVFAKSYFLVSLVHVMQWRCLVVDSMTSLPQ